MKITDSDRKPQWEPAGETGVLWVGSTTGVEVVVVVVEVVVVVVDVVSPVGVVVWVLTEVPVLVTVTVVVTEDGLDVALLTCATTLGAAACTFAFAATVLAVDVA